MGNGNAVRAEAGAGGVLGIVGSGRSLSVMVMLRGRGRKRPGEQRDSQQQEPFRHFALSKRGIAVTRKWEREKIAD